MRMQTNFDGQDETGRLCGRPYIYPWRWHGKVTCWGTDIERVRVIAALLNGNRIGDCCAAIELNFDREEPSDKNTDCLFCISQTNRWFIDGSGFNSQ